MTNENQEQQDELCVLSSIYTNEEFVADDDSCGGTFFAFVTLPSGFIVSYKNFADDKVDQLKIPINHLPPISLTFKYPKNYPAEAKPDFVISCPWLSITKLNKICGRLDELWEENCGMVIMYTWTEFLKNESLDCVGIANILDLSRQYQIELKKKGCKVLNKNRVGDKPMRKRHDRNQEVIKTNGDTRLRKPTTSFTKDPRIVGTPITNMHLHEYLISFNEDKIKTVFLRSIFTCAICFQDKLGDKCIEFNPCGHVYCKDCIGGYFEVRIKENLIESMPCPYEKCKSEAHQHQIKELVGNLLFAKYDTLLLNATLDTMSDITYCPRTICGCPVMRDTDDKMGACPKCQFVFCVYCKMTYHGIEPCKIKSEEKRKLIEEYEQGDAATKARLEKRYGKKQIQTYITIAKSENWIASNSKNCPSCNASIEKSDGCNKMVCSKCKAFFCWICLTRLDPASPYKHYIDNNSKCFNQLFQGVVQNFDDDFGDEEDFGDFEDPIGYTDSEDEDDIEFIFDQLNANFLLAI